MREVAASGGHLFIRPGCLRSLQALSQDSQSTSAATMISRIASVITNTQVASTEGDDWAKATAAEGKPSVPTFLWYLDARHSEAHAQRPVSFLTGVLDNN